MAGGGARGGGSGTPSLRRAGKAAAAPAWRGNAWKHQQSYASAWDRSRTLGSARERLRAPGSAAWRLGAL
eukprot:1408417-Pyramimonas_sp.AAC.1